MVVADSDAVREAIARSFTRRGCQVTTAASGPEGLEALRSQQFDAVVCDVNMPEQGGLWLWEQAVTERHDLRGRFVLISAEPLPQPRSMQLFVESERFLLKPLSLLALWHEVRKIVEQRAKPPKMQDQDQDQREWEA